MEKKKKIPERKCSGCGGTFPKRELIRVVRQPDGSVVLDGTGKKSGRGAYLCTSLSCFKKAMKSNRIARSLEVEIPAEVTAALEAEIKAFEEEKNG